MWTGGVLSGSFPLLVGRMLLRLGRQNESVVQLIQQSNQKPMRRSGHDRHNYRTVTSANQNANTALFFHCIVGFVPTNYPFWNKLSCILEIMRKKNLVWITGPERRVGECVEFIKHRLLCRTWQKQKRPRITPRAWFLCKMQQQIHTLARGREYWRQKHEEK